MNRDLSALRLDGMIDREWLAHAASLDRPRAARHRPRRLDHRAISDWDGQRRRQAQGCQPELISGLRNRRDTRSCRPVTDQPMSRYPAAQVGPQRGADRCGWCFARNHGRLTRSGEMK